MSLQSRYLYLLVIVALLITGTSLINSTLVKQAEAAPITLFDNESYDGDWITAQGSNWLAQSFNTPGSTTTITSVAIKLRNTNYSSTSSVAGTYSLSLWSSANNEPASQVATIATNVSVVSWANGTTTHVLPTAFQATANTTYFVVLQGSAGGTMGWKCRYGAVTAAVSPAPTYSSLVSTDGGTNWSSLPTASRCNPDGAGNPSHFLMIVNGAVQVAASLSNFSDVNATEGDAPITITPPTANTAGTFSYASSNSSVVTITGNQLTVGSPGTAVITATFSPNDSVNFSSASITANVIVAARSASTTTTTTTTKPRREATTPLDKTSPTPVATSTTTSTTTTSTSIAPTTTSLPDETGDEITVPSSPSRTIFGDDEAQELQIQIEAQEGDPLSIASLRIAASDLIPESPISVTVFSDPQLLLSSNADTNGDFSADVALPTNLESGRHTVVAESQTDSGKIQVVGAFVLDEDLRLTTIVQPKPITNFEGPNDARVVQAAELQRAIYDPATRPLTVASIAVAAAALIALLGATGLANPLTLSGSGSQAGASNRQRNSRGKLANAVTKKLKGINIDNVSSGDTSFTWKSPGTQYTDRLSRELPNRAGKWSAVMPRILVDGAWLRAMFGSLGLLPWVAGVVLGCIAATYQTQSAMTPSFALLAIIVALGILDAGAGATAWITMVIVHVVSGTKIAGDNIGWADLRTALGFGILVSTVSLLAHVIRPLRRHVSDNSFERWERALDYVIMPVFVSFAAGSMLKAVNGLSGFEIVSSVQVSDMRWVVFTAILVRLVGEDIAAHWYPKRMIDVQPAKLVSPGKTPTSVGITTRSLLFVIVAEPFFGITATTITAAILLAIPQILKMWEDDLPNSSLLNKWLPRGLFRFLCLLIIGAWLTAILIQDSNDPSQIKSSFIWLLLPGVAVGVVELFARFGGDWKNVALKRTLGVGVWILAAGIVTGNIILFS